MCFVVGVTDEGTAISKYHPRSVDVVVVCDSFVKNRIGGLVRRTGFEQVAVVRRHWRKIQAGERLGSSASDFDDASEKKFETTFADVEDLILKGVDDSSNALVGVDSHQNDGDDSNSDDENSDDDREDEVVALEFVAARRFFVLSSSKSIVFFALGDSGALVFGEEEEYFGCCC